MPTESSEQHDRLPAGRICNFLDVLELEEVAMASGFARFAMMRI